MGPEALPEIQVRLQKDDLPTELLGVYAAVLAETGGEQALPDLRAFWQSPRARGEGLRVKRPVVLALTRQLGPEAGQILLTLWQEEDDPGVQALLAQAIQANPKVNAPLANQAWLQATDEKLRARLQDLLVGMAVQDAERKEARALSALPLGDPETLQTLKAALTRPGSGGQAVAVARLEQEGSPEAVSALLAYARSKDVERGLRYEALAASCRKANEGTVTDVAAWYVESPADARMEILDAVGQSNNPRFLPFATEASSRAGDDRLHAKAQRAFDLLTMAKARQDLGFKR